MHVDIRTVNVKPLRNTFDHLAARFGDKAATRYQEATFDVQPETNFHYKPLWDPEREIFDKRRTAIVMKDFYALKDPRQFFYGSYTMTRAKQQEALDGHMQFIEKRDLMRHLPEDVQNAITTLLVPMRHYEWGANMANAQIAAYGWGTAITQAAMMATMDRLGMAQHLSRLGLLLDGNQGTSLLTAKTEWTDNPAFQPLRRDFAFLVDTGVSADALLRAARGADRTLITGVTLFDVYEGDKLPAGKKSLAVEVTFQPRERTLTDAEIEAAGQKVIAAVAKATGAALR